MSTSNLFFKGCFSDLTEEQLQAIEDIGAEGNLIDESCARETNTCGMDLSELLDTYELYDFQRGVLFTKWGDLEFPWEINPSTSNLNYEKSDKEWDSIKYIGRTSYRTGDRVLYIEDDGYIISVYEANQDIEAPAGPLDRTKWDKFCSIEFSEPVQLPTIQELIDNYNFYLLKEFFENWGEASEEWKIAETYEFSIVDTSSGNKYVVNGTQQDTINLMRGRRYIFKGSSITSHPIRLSLDSENDFQYNIGYSVGANNTHTFEVPANAPDTLYYYCLNHAGMGGSISISDFQGRNTDEWGDYKIRRDFFYKVGEFVLVESQCSDAFCLWINVRNLPVSDNNLVTFSKFAPYYDFQGTWTSTGTNVIRVNQPKHPYKVDDVIKVVVAGGATEVPAPEQGYFTDFKEYTIDSVIDENNFTYTINGAITASSTPRPINIVQFGPFWEKIYCVNSGQNKCLGPQSDRNLDNYQFIEIGSKGHYVEQPIPYYKLDGNYICEKDNYETLGEIAELRPRKVLTQEEINILDGSVEASDPTPPPSEDPPSSGPPADTTPPTSNITTPILNLGVSDTALLTIVLSENSPDFALSSLSSTGGTLSEFGGSAGVYTVRFTPLANSTADGVITVISGSYNDEAGNSGEGSSITLNVDTVPPSTPPQDTTPPTSTISSSTSSLGVGQTATLSISLSEDSSNFTSSDITATGGTLSGFSGSGSNYGIIFTPTPNSTNNGVVTIANGSFTDAAGNNGVGSSIVLSVNTIPADTTPPAISINTPNSSLGFGEIATLTFTLSEGSTNFTIQDISAAGGTISSFSGSGTSYSAVFTPATNSTATGVISVAAGAFTDSAGNSNVAGASISIPVDTTTSVTNYTVTVQSVSTGYYSSGNRYFIDGVQQATLSLVEGQTYRFNQDNNSNTNHPLRFSTTSNGTHAGGSEFTQGVTKVGTPGSNGAYTEITVPAGTPTLYYYCANHSLMGGTANT